MITMNITPASSAATVQLAYTIALLLAFPVTMFPVVQMFETLIWKDQKSNMVTWQKNALRALLTIVAAGIATGGGSSFDNFISLVGMRFFCVFVVVNLLIQNTQSVE
jgi:hypothetical protein